MTANPLDIGPSAPVPKYLWNFDPSQEHPSWSHATLLQFALDCQERSPPAGVIARHLAFGVQLQ